MLKTSIKIAAVVVVFSAVAHILPSPDFDSTLFGVALGMTVAVMFPGWLLGRRGGVEQDH